MNYFDKGQRGKHLAFGQQSINRNLGGQSQGDYYSMYSFYSYKRDIAGAYEHGFYRLARANGWSYGFSICGWKAECSDQTNGGPSFDLPAGCRLDKDPYSEKCCPKNGTTPCMLTVVENYPHGHNFIVRTSDTAPFEMSKARKVDLAYNIRLYCPEYNASSSSVFNKRSLKYLRGGPFAISQAGDFNLTAEGSVWPKGC
jgi:hypothetical protein